MAAVYLPSHNFSEKPSPTSFCFSTANKPLIPFSGVVKLKPLGSNQRRIRNFVCRAASSVAIRDLDADDIRHPLDKQNTLILRAIPGLNEIGKALLGTVAEQVMLLENIGTSVLVSENQLPELHDLMTEAASILNIEAPDLYLRQSPVPNAYTLAISGKKPFVVVHTSLVELLSRKELQAVLAHELGHLKCDHGVWLTFANILTLGAYSVPGLGSLIAQQLEEQLFRWLRAAELTCDRAALLVARDPKMLEWRSIRMELHRSLHLSNTFFFLSVLSFRILYSCLAVCMPEEIPDTISIAALPSGTKRFFESMYFTVPVIVHCWSADSMRLGSEFSKTPLFENSGKAGPDSKPPFSRRALRKFRAGSVRRRTRSMSPSRNNTTTPFDWVTNESEISRGNSSHVDAEDKKIETTPSRSLSKRWVLLEEFLLYRSKSEEGLGGGDKEEDILAV
ncbi:protease htpx homolog 2 [Phtheirospermum japonicum]|uniref:Protease htpx homolog 2 n=1 Tax=Phtheirospermum japonicum TaxID=374723 RepID=A0A830CNJ6_9LAMI|nr:protease htpx homolog 2 [Phtheirospermum japonicum]